MKPINTTLIIGNGFDLSLGMKTSYKSFYEYLEERSFFDKYKELPLIEYIHNSIKRDLWYDFESIIKEFATQHYPRDNEFATKNQEQMLAIINKRKADAEKAMRLLTENLKTFLARVNPIVCNSAAMRILLAVLGIKDDSIDSSNEKMLGKVVGGHYVFPDNIKIISFNYTDTLLHIGRILESIGIALLLNNDKCSNLTQIHGKLKSSIAFGADKIVSVSEEYKCLCKAYYLNGNPKQEFIDTLAYSERVVIFGHSVHGLDFEYYEDFFMSKPSPKNVYVVCHNQKGCQEIRDALLKKGIPPFITYISTDNKREFEKLCDDILADCNM